MYAWVKFAWMIASTIYHVLDVDLDKYVCE